MKKTGNKRRKEKETSWYERNRRNVYVFPSPPCSSGTQKVKGWEGGRGGVLSYESDETQKK
jgi:hypothetical protein